MTISAQMKTTIPTPQQLRKQHLEEALQNKVGSKGIEAVPLSKRTGIMYNARLQRLVNQIRKRINENIVPLIRRLESQYTADSWDDDINSAFDDEFNFWSSENVHDVFEQILKLLWRLLCCVQLSKLLFHGQGLLLLLENKLCFG